ncbi:hypothetical protein WICPIJ_009905 [Wickerhamomyces pijperi]|uniref:Uncharacterized protein n=1 Tax=Wickerhamomyces pijperi TaxID=599730 RepID=A0A9P8TB64_WICPI|nr:hypothetical protein WICPIJ_009905 [Wickerhamomyces pijperi]
MKYVVKVVYCSAFNKSSFGLGGLIITSLLRGGWVSTVTVVRWSSSSSSRTRTRRSRRSRGGGGRTTSGSRWGTWLLILLVSGVLVWSTNSSGRRWLSGCRRRWDLRRLVSFRRRNDTFSLLLILCGPIRTWGVSGVSHCDRSDGFVVVCSGSWTTRVLWALVELLDVLDEQRVHSTNLNDVALLLRLQDPITTASGHPSDVEQLGPVDVVGILTSGHGNTTAFNLIANGVFIFPESGGQLWTLRHLARINDCLLGPRLQMAPGVAHGHVLRLSWLLEIACVGVSTAVPVVAEAAGVVAVGRWLGLMFAWVAEAAAAAAAAVVVVVVVVGGIDMAVGSLGCSSVAGTGIGRKLFGWFVVGRLDRTCTDSQCKDSRLC